MSIDVDNLHMDSAESGLPVIKVFGVGGGGGNVVNRMVEGVVKGVSYVAANTDMMVLESSLAGEKIALGRNLTKGLGAGMRPEVGKAAAEEEVDAIREVLTGSDLVFIAAGMGGGTGTGAAPVIAEVAKEMNILTVGVVTLPFRFEGPKRTRLAKAGVEELKKHVDTVMVIPNNKLLEIASPKTTMTEAFSLADDVLKQGIQGIINLVNLEGVINLDFADLRTVMSNKGAAIMGMGVGQGKNRGLDAATAAISSPLLSEQSIDGATGVIINIVADEKFSLLDAEAAATFIQDRAHEDADVIFGLVYDDDMDDEVSLSVIATGFDPEQTAAAHDIKTHLRVAHSAQSKGEEAPISGKKQQEVANDSTPDEDDILVLDEDMIDVSHF